MKAMNNQVVYSADSFQIFVWELISLLVVVVILPWDYNSVSILAKEYAL